MEFKKFAEFLAEREKLVQLYGIHAKGQTPGKAMAASVKPPKPIPYDGLHVHHIYAKPRRNKPGVIG